MSFEIVTVFVRLTAIENRALELEPAILKPACYHAETDVTRVLQMMRQRRRRILRSGSPVHKRIWPKRRLSWITCIDEPARAFANRHGVRGTQLHEQIVWMLSIDQGLAFVSLTRLEQERRAAWRKR